MSSEAPPDTLKAMKGVMKRLEQKNMERINKMESLKARNRKVGFGITGMVLGICKLLISLAENLLTLDFLCNRCIFDVGSKARNYFR